MASRARLDRRLHVALVAPPFVRVPPEGYGGTELVVADLAEALVSFGHRVTLFATGDSAVSGCEVRWLFRRPLWPPEPVAEWNHAVFAAHEAAEVGASVIHSNVPALVALAGSTAPMVHTVHHPADRTLWRHYRAHPFVRYVAISARQAELSEEAWVRPPAVVHHGLNVDRYPAGEGEAGDALFLGRLDEVKAPHLALMAAREAGLGLRIAGRPHEGDYFERVLGPELRRGGGQLIGEVGGEAKTRALGSARVLLFTSVWEEPFGLAAIEAMLCGTPVVALRRGALGETVEPGTTGVLVDRPEDLPAAIRRALSLSRAKVRERARERFSAERMALGYLAAYREALELDRWPARAELQA